MPVAVTMTHEEYDARKDEWKRIHDVLAGRDAVIEAGQEYVPRLDQQSPDEYKAYLLRGLWPGYAARAHEGIVGLVFSQEPQRDVPAAIAPLLEDVTLSDMSFAEFAKAVFSEVTSYAWGGILTDVIPMEQQGIPQDDRPYLTHYDAGCVTWWDWERINGKWQVTLVVLREKHYERNSPSKDDPHGYGKTSVDQYRVLYLRRETTVEQDRPITVNTYEQHVWRKATEGEYKNEWVQVETIIPTRGTEPLTEIPWVFTPSKGIVPCIYKSALLDIVDVNLDLWRLMVDHRHGEHFTALPTPCASGAERADMAIDLGPQSAIVSTNPAFKTWFLEFSGAGLNTVRQSAEDDKAMLATLGSRLLETQKRAAETAEAMTLRQAGENSVVMTLALSVGKALEKALWWMAWWRNVEDPQVSVSLTSAITELEITTPDLTVLLSARKSNDVSEETWLEALERKRLLGGRTVDEETALIAVQKQEAQQRQIEQQKQMAAVSRNSGFGGAK